MPVVASLTVMSEEPVILLMAVGQFQIGRGTKSDLRIAHRTVSRQHATIVVESGSAKVIDQQSRNGTYVKQERVAEVELTHGMEIRFGDVGCLFARLDQPMTEDATTMDGSGQTDLLTKAEERVFLLLLSGHSEKEIARRLHLSPHTVHNHVKRIYRAYGVHSRADLLARFIRPTHRQ